MYYLVGLGNPGKEYDLTRHNVGFLALDFLTKKMSLPEAVSSSKYSGRVCVSNIENEEVTLLYPDTFMNNSGAAVKKLVPQNELSQLVVIYDDVALPFGEIKISFGRGDGGHNGIKSIIKELGTKDFVRVRVGVAPLSFWTGEAKVLTGDKMVKFVLGNFSKSESVALDKEVFMKVQSAVCEVVKEGYVKAMNTVNYK